MNLLEVRTDLAKKSGRYDLVNPSDYSDNGMDFHINAGQKYLDKLAEVPEAYAQIFEALASDEYSITFQQQCRAITSVFVNNDTSRYEIERIDLKDLKNAYESTIGNTDSGAPCFYAIAHLRALETTAQTTLGTFINLTWLETDTKYDYRGIIIVPPVDEAYTIEISGKFLQKVLSADLDTNYWATEYPHLLIMAALRSIEVFNRNTEGIKDWSMAIQSETIMLDYDSAEEESYNIDQMGG